MVIWNCQDCPCRKFSNKRHPKTKVPFDGKGFPNFEKDVKYDTRINTAVPQVNPIDEPVFNPKGSVGSAHSWSITARIQYAKLPRQGRIRYIPPKNYSPSAPLPKGPNNGYLDKFGNEWTKGPSRTKGQEFEWDVQLSKTGREQLGWASRDGKHLNISIDGKITHK